MRKPCFWNQKLKKWSGIILKSSKCLKEHPKTKIQDFHYICMLIHCAMCPLLVWNRVNFVRKFNHFPLNCFEWSKSKIVFIGNFLQILKFWKSLQNFHRIAYFFSFFQFSLVLLYWYSLVWLTSIVTANQKEIHLLT